MRTALSAVVLNQSSIDLTMLEIQWSLPFSNVLSFRGTASLEHETRHCTDQLVYQLLIHITSIKTYIQVVRGHSSKLPRRPFKTPLAEIERGNNSFRKTGLPKRFRSLFTRFQLLDRMGINQDPGEIVEQDQLPRLIPRDSFERIKILFPFIKTGVGSICHLLEVVFGVWSFVP